MHSGRNAITLLLGALVLCAGCRLDTKPQRRDTLLTRAKPSLETVSLDIFFVRMPYDDQATYDQVWERIDEQVLAPEVRRELQANGFRAGLIAGQLPEAVTRLLEKEGSRPAEPEPSGGTPLEGANTVKIDEGGVRIRHLQLRPGRRGEIIASRLYDKLPLLVREGQRVSGRTYERCQGILAVKVDPLGDGRAKLEFVPEVHFGENQQRAITQGFGEIDGVWRMPTGRPRTAFPQLTIETTLPPGNMIAIGALPEDEGSLGHYFCSTDESGKREHKVLILRVAQTQLDNLFLDAPTEPGDAVDELSPDAQP